MSMVSTAEDITKMVFDLEVWDLHHLSRTLTQIRSKDCVSLVERVNG